MDSKEYEEAANYWVSREAAVKRMPADELRASIDAFLSSHNTCALATGAGDFVRCTPLEYAWRDGSFWMFSEGGLKFRGLASNKNVGLAVYEPYGGFGTLESAQITGVAEIVDPDSPEFAQAAAAKNIPATSLDRIKGMLHLIKVTPTRIDYLSSKLKQLDYDPRQWVELGQ